MQGKALKPQEDLGTSTKPSIVSTLTQFLPVYKLTVTLLLVPHFDKGTDNFTLTEDNEWTCIFEGF